MAADYTVSLAIIVEKGDPPETVVNEGASFSNRTFAKMANIADLYYELVDKIEKLK